MNLRNRLIIVILITILLVGIGVLIWANQTHRITIWGEGPGESYPKIVNGQSVAIEGTLLKNGDIFYITKNNQFPYDIYILNSYETSSELAPLVGKSVSIFGSLSGNADNEMLVLWINGKALFTEEEGWIAYYNRIDKNATDAVESLNDAQKNCITAIISLDEYKLLLISETLSNLSQDKKTSVNKCINEAK